MSLDRCEGTLNLFNRSVPQITVDLNFQTMNFDQASQENSPIVKVKGKKDLCPRQGLGFRDRDCRSRDFILSGSIFLLSCYTDPASAHKVPNVFVWRHWHVVGRKAQPGGTVGMEQDPFSWHCHRDKDRDISSLIPSALQTPPPKPTTSKALPAACSLTEPLQRQWGVSQGFCNGLYQITVWKEV